MVIQPLTLRSKVELLDGFAFANAVSVGIGGVAADIVEIAPAPGGKMFFWRSKPKAAIVGGVEIEIEHDGSHGSIRPWLP